MVFGSSIASAIAKASRQSPLSTAAARIAWGNRLEGSRTSSGPRGSGERMDNVIFLAALAVAAAAVAAIIIARLNSNANRVPG